VDLFDTTQLALSKAMVGSTMRQQALAQNIANVDTPGYRRVDVDFESALRDALQTGPAQASSAVDAVTFSEKTDAAAPVQADGNSVDLSTEAATEAMNGLNYQALVTVASTRISILQNAMGVK
jgi:flagellar basal-body rod protein FlgB